MIPPYFHGGPPPEHPPWMSVAALWIIGLWDIIGLILQVLAHSWSALLYVIGVWMIGTSMRFVRAATE